MFDPTQLLADFVAQTHDRGMVRVMALCLEDEGEPLAAPVLRDFARRVLLLLDRHNALYAALKTARAELDAARSEVAPLSEYKSAADVMESLEEIAGDNTGEPTQAMADEIWALMSRPGTTAFSLAVCAWERGQNFKRVNAELKTARAEGEAAAVMMRDAVIDYVDRSLAACRSAVEQRESDIGKRAENASIMPMLREQAHAWREKTSSYEALRDFLRSLPTPTAALDGMLAEARSQERERCVDACHGVAFKGTRGNESTVVHVVNECARAIRALPANTKGV